MEKKYRFTSRSAVERQAEPLGRYFVVVSSVDRSTHRLSADEYAVASLFDGERRSEVVLEIARRDKSVVMSPEQLSEFIVALSGRNLLEEIPDASAPESPPLDAPAEEAASETSPADAALDEEIIGNLGRRTARARSGLPLRIPSAWMLPSLRSLARTVTSPPFIVALLLLTLFCLYGIFHHWADFERDIARLFRPAAFLASLIPAVLLVDLLAQLLRLGAIARHSSHPPSFGIVFVGGILPTFQTDMSPLRLMSSANRRNVVVGSLNARLLVFVVSVLGWLMTRGSPSTTPLIYLVLVLTAALALFRSANLMAKREAYFLVASKLEIPDLYERALALVVGKRLTAILVGLDPNSPLMARSAHRKVPTWMLLVYALAITAYFVLLVVAFFWFIGRPLEENFGGLGVVIFCAILLAVAWRPLRRLVRSLFGIGARPRAPTGSAAAAAERQRAGQAAWLGVPMQRKRRFPWGSILRVMFLTLFILVLFLPYTYETSGRFEFLPQERQNVNARTSGEIVRVNFRGGEQVKKGTVIANLDSHDQTHAIETARQAVAEQEAALEVAIKTNKLKESELARVDHLYQRGFATPQAIDEARAAAETSKDQIVQIEATLAKAKQQLKQAQIELERTELRMPFDGQIVTTELHKKLSVYLEEGSLFAVVEQTQNFEARVEVPEADAGEIKVGSKVTLRAWPYPLTEKYGTVRSIDPALVETKYGRVVNTYVEVQATAADGLKSGMTGSAKIEAVRTIVAVAFTRLLVRFFLIEIWSWIP